MPTPTPDTTTSNVDSRDAGQALPQPSSDSRQVELELAGELIGLDDFAHPRQRRQAALLALGRRTAALSETGNLLTDGAEMAASVLGLCQYGIAMPGQDFEGNLKLGQVGQRKLKSLKISLRKTESAIGYAMAAGRCVTFADLASESRFQDAPLVSRRVSAGIVCPLLKAGKSLGAMGLFASDAHRELDRDQVQFVESVAYLLSSTLACEHAENAAREQSTFSNTVLNSMDNLLVVLDAAGRIDQINSACEKLTGFSMEQLQGRALASALLVPEEIAIVSNTLSDVRRGSTLERCESYLLTKEGERRRVSWIWTSVSLPGTGRQLVGTAVDITTQCLAIERAERVEADLQQLQETLHEIQQEQEESRLTVISQLDANAHQPERRKRPRRAYPYIQRIAPLLQGKMPAWEDFRETRCRDISSQGFSFLTSIYPDYDELMVAFGTPPALLYLTASVRHVTKTHVDRKQMFHVGCVYTGRPSDTV